MSGRDETITELDLHAYADGLLDSDPARKAAVEAYLRASPETARRVADYARQNELIRRAYGTALEEPVPERLYAALRGTRRPRRWRRLGNAAALAAVALGAGAGGWLLGNVDGADGWQSRAFVERAMVGHMLSSTQRGAEVRVARGVAARPLDWLTGQLPVRIRLPDLSEHGYAVTDKRILTADGQRLAQIVYAGPGGKRLSLFLQPRWQDEDAPRMRMIRGDGVDVAYWMDGPFAYGLAADADGDQLRRLAARVREAMHRREPSLPPIVPGPGFTPSRERAAIAGEQPALTRPDRSPAIEPSGQSGL